MLLAQCVLLKGRMCTKVLLCNSVNSNTATHRCNAMPGSCLRTCSGVTPGWSSTA